MSSVPVVVIKCGSGGVDTARVAADLAALRAEGRRIVLVHGGADDIDELACHMGVVQKRLEAPDGITTRYTDAAMLEVVVLALTGRTKPRWLRALAREGIPAIGVSGLDAKILVAARKHAHRAMVEGRVTIVRDDHSGRIVSVASNALLALLDAGFVPVVSPPAVDEDGSPLNVDADRAAAAVAGALGATDLVLLTNTPGVLSDVADERSLISELVLPREGRADVTTSGGMGLKLVAAREALAAGVARVVIGDGRVDTPVRAALSGSGTRLLLAPSEHG